MSMREKVVTKDGCSNIISQRLKYAFHPCN